jgi:hypothetical protein
VTQRRIALLVAAAVLVLGACATGERPSFDTGDPFPAGEPTGDANIDTVARLLETPNQEPATATYLVTLNLGGSTTEVVVVREPGRRSITAAGIRFIEEGSTLLTCRLGTGEPCQDGWQSQLVSDSIINPDFAGDAAVRRLRRDAAASIAPTTLEAATVADQQAQCVTIQVPGGTVQYCALNNGTLARIVDSDITVDLTSYSSVVDPAAFATS